jgi:hypothetical protein
MPSASSPATAAEWSLLPTSPPSTSARSWPVWPIAALLAAVYLIVDPPSADLAAQVYRVDLFAHHGFVLWDGAWYSGHHIPGYSVLFPPLGALLGPRLAGALSAVLSAILFERLAREHFGARSWVGAAWFAAATAMNLITGRLAFGLGITFAIATLLVITHRRIALGMVLAAATTLASPVAGLFLGLGALAWLIAGRRPVAFALGAAAIGPALVLVVAFPEGGSEPFVASSFWPALAGCAFIYLALPVAERELRIGVLLYALACVAAFAIPSPVGGNVVRLGTLFGGPVLACLLWRRQVIILGLMALPLVWWQWSAPIRDVVRASGDPSVHPSFFAPLVHFLHTQGGPPFRVEIPFTADHWEAAEVAPSVPLARGWERQLDREDNGLFYSGRLTVARYRTWLGENAVRFIALPDAPLDSSAHAEAALLRRPETWLRLVWHDRDWRVWELRAPTPMASGSGALTRMGTDGFTVRARAPGTLFVRERFTPYWALVQGAGCVSQAPGGYTEVRLRRAGVARVAVRFSLARVVEHGRRCSP